jgi:sortase (surface protein transpeptidase)
MTLMKKWMTLVFACVFALGLSIPAWSQSTTGTNKQATTAEKKADKDSKKEASKKKKADKKAADKKAKEDKQNAKKDATKK